jgi:hypothetical protein
MSAGQATTGKQTAETLGFPFDKTPEEKTGRKERLRKAVLSQ